MSTDKIVLPDDLEINNYKNMHKIESEDKKPHFSVNVILDAMNNLKKHRESIETKIEKLKEDLNNLNHSRTAVHAQNVLLADLLKKIDIQ